MIPSEYKPLVKVHQEDFLTAKSIYVDLNQFPHAFYTIVLTPIYQLSSSVLYEACFQTVAECFHHFFIRSIVGG